MKTRILIVEDSFAKFFCTKQLLESHFHVPVKTMDTESAEELVQAINSVRPTLMFVRPTGGVTSLMLKLENRHVNRRNTQITLILTEDLEETWLNSIQTLSESSTSQSRDKSQSHQRTGS